MDGFIAYIGSELDEKEIKKLLLPVAIEKQDEYDEEYNVRIRTTSNGVVFGQVIEKGTNLDYALPYLFRNKLLYVGCYEYNELSDISDEYNEYDIDEYDQSHEIIPLLMGDYDEFAFKMLEKKDFTCSFVCYDKNSKKLIAFKIGDGNLYYGYTKYNHEIVFSDHKEIIQKICGSVVEFPNNSYYSNGNIYQIDQPREDIKYENPDVFDQRESSKKDLLFNDFNSAKNLLDGLNNLLYGITDTALRARIENSFKEYFEGIEPKKQINDYLEKSFSSEIKKKLLEIVQQEIKNYEFKEKVQSQLNDTYDIIEEKISAKVKEKIKSVVSTLPIPTIHIIKIGDNEIGRTNAEFFHEKFEEILSFVQLEEPVMLIGPAGSGKSHTVGQIAKALGLTMYNTNSASNEFKLTGFIDAGGNYRNTEFYKAYKNGGLFFLDEIDNSDSSALIVINTALANGYMAFPHETVERHPNFRIVAAANTWGKGSDLQYVGRNALDASTLDRFDNIFFDYDRLLEQKLYPNDQVLKFMWAFRDAVEKSKIPHIVSTRGIQKVYKKEINGISPEAILRADVVKNLGQDDLNIILGQMNGINSNNKYYNAAKTLLLRK